MKHKLTKLMVFGVTLVAWVLMAAYNPPIVWVDLDIDSDHTTDYGGPERDDFEDSIEAGSSAKTNEGLKFVVVNELHETEDEGKPGYADWQIFSPFGPHTNDANIFVPLVLEVPEPFVSPTVTFDYPAYEPTDPYPTTTQDDEVVYPLETNSQNFIRLWLKDMNAYRDPSSVVDGGDFIPANVGLSTAVLNFTGKTNNLYMEALSPSADMEDIEVEVTLSETINGYPVTCVDLIKATAIRIDLDVDSNNDDGFSLPERNLAEDHYEDIVGSSNRLGKVIMVNDADKDDDQVPDFADGYNLNGIPDEDDMPPTTNNFVPLVMEIPTPVNIGDARISISYDASCPLSDCVYDPVTTNYSILNGNMRIWTKDGNEVRDGNPIGGSSGGDYVKPGIYSATDLGFSASSRSITLYIEAVACSPSAGDQRIMVQLDPNGNVKDPPAFIAADAVRTTLIALPLVVTDYFTPRQQESPPYHVCKIDYSITNFLLSSIDTIRLEIKQGTNVFYMTEWPATTSAKNDTKLYELNSTETNNIYDVTDFYDDQTTWRVCWDGRKDADGDGVIDTKNGFAIWADRPANIDASPVSFSARIVLLQGSTAVAESPVDITKTCPLPLDANDLPLAGPAPYFGLFRDQINSLYQSVQLASPSITPANDGRPVVNFTAYYNGNHWQHSPMKFGWTHTYEIRVLPVYVGGVRQIYLLGEGDHLFGPVSANGNVWIYGERADLAETTTGFVITNRLKTVLSFNDFGQIMTVTDKNGNTVTVTLEPFETGKDLMIQRVSTVVGPGPDLELAYSDENTQLDSITLGDRKLTFEYYAATNVYGAPYSADEVMKTISGLEYSNAFAMANGRRKNRPSRVICGAMTNRAVGAIVHNFGFSPDEDLTTPVSEAKVVSYDIGGTWRRTTIASSTATYDVGRTITHDYTLNKLQTVTVTGTGGSAVYNYAYNDLGQRTKMSTANGNTAFGPYDAVGNLLKLTPPTDRRPVNYAYDTLWNVVTNVSMTSPNRQTTCTLDVKGNVQTNIETGDATHANRSWGYVRNADGTVATVTDPVQTISTYTYNNDLGLPSQITRSGVKLLDRAYDVFGNVASDSDASSPANTTGYEYDALDRTKKITYPNTQFESFEYTPLNQIKKHTAVPAGQTTSGLVTDYSFDASGKPDGRTETGDGVDRDYNYTDIDDEGNPRVVNAFEGGDTLESTFTYDYADRALSETWDGVSTPRWQVDYDPFGNVLSMTDGEDQTSTTTYYSDNSIHMHTRPEGFGSVTRLMDGAGNTTTLTDVNATPGMSSVTAVTRYVPDCFNRVATVTDPMTKVWHYAYDVTDNLTNAVTPRGSVYRYAYDARSYLSTNTLPDGNTVPVTADANGALTSLQVPKGDIYTFSTDFFGTKETAPPIGGVYGPTMINAYGMPFESKRGDVLTKINYDAAGRVSDYAPSTLNGSSRIIENALFGAKKITMRDNKIVSRDPVTTANPLFRRITAGGSVAEATLDGNGQTKTIVLKAANDPDRTIGMQYDAMGNPHILTEGAKSTTTRYDAHGNLRSLSSPGASQSFQYDAADRLIQSTINGRTVSYGYDDNGNCISLTPPGPLSLTFAYDDRDQLTNRTIRINGTGYRTDTISRDANGAIIQRTIRSATNAVICNETFGRDAIDRKTEIETRTATDKLFLTYSPDSQINEEDWAGVCSTLIGADGLVMGVVASPAFTFTRDPEGRLKTVTHNGNAVYQYDYDASGLLVQEMDTTSTNLGGTAVITHVNDALGHSKERGLPGGGQLTETVNTAGHVTSSSLTVAGVPRTASFTLQDDVTLTSIAIPGYNQPIALAYNSAFELTGISAGTASTTLTRDTDTGRILTKTLGHLGVTDTYTFHPMGRIASEIRSDGSFNAQYTYDEAGCRLTAQVTDNTPGYTGFIPPAFINGQIYRVGASMPYTNIAHALAAVAVDCGTNAFTTPAIIQLEPGVYSAPIIIAASNLTPTAANRLIIQGRPSTNAVFLGPVTVSAPNHTLWRGLILSGPVVCTNVIDAAISSCIVSGSVTFAQCKNAAIVGNTFDYAVPTNTPVPRILIDGGTNALVRNNIFLAPTNAVVLVQANGAPASAGNNLHWRPNLVTDSGSPVIQANPFLDATTYAITTLVSRAVAAGAAVAGYEIDFYGNLRNPTNPCLGAIEVVLDDDGALIINPGVGGLTGWTSIARDRGGRIIRRTYCGHVQNLAYDGRGRLTAWDWSGSSANATTYAYDHAGRRVLIEETLGGRATVTRCVYDGADVCTEFVDTNTDGAVDRTRVYWLLPGMDRRIGFADITNGVATFYYYLTDHVGTVLRIVDDAGTVVNQYDYDAWGNVRWGGSNTFENVENRYLFHGREWDRNGGFYYFRNRIYLPERGEFASPDRNLGRGILGEMDGMGTLTFCGGDPVNCIDPLGLKTARWESRGFNEWSRNLCGRLGITKLIWDLDTEEIAKISSLESQIANFRQQMPSARGQQADELGCAIDEAEGYIQAIHEWDPNWAGPREGQTFTFPFAKYEKDPKNFFFLRDFGRAFSAGFYTGLATGVAMQETEVVAAKTPLDWDAVVPTKGPYKGQVRTDHVRLHNVDNPAKPAHGVFYGDGVDLTNQAWLRAQQLGLKADAAGTLKVPMGRIVGRAGGQTADTGELFYSVEIKLVPNSNKLITSYPTN